jgi:hypothetical protein
MSLAYDFTRWLEIVVQVPKQGEALTQLKEVPIHAYFGAVEATVGMSHIA